MAASRWYPSVAGALELAGRSLGALGNCLSCRWNTPHRRERRGSERRLVRCGLPGSWRVADTIGRLCRRYGKARLPFFLLDRPARPAQLTIEAESPTVIRWSRAIARSLERPGCAVEVEPVNRSSLFKRAFHLPQPDPPADTHRVLRPTEPALPPRALKAQPDAGAEVVAHAA